MNESRQQRILLLTYAFLPVQAAESFLVAKALSKVNSYTIDVLTLDYDNIGIPTDDSLSDYVQENFGKIYRAKPPLWINKKVFSFLRYTSFFPDRFRFFNDCIFKKAIDINAGDYDAIISWSQWHSIHLAALKIKKKFPSLPWIAHFSDPWSDNPFLSRFIGYGISQYLLERSVIKYADAVDFTTHLTRILVMKKYKKEWMDKTYVTFHSYDSSMFIEQCIDSSDKLSVVYLGNFYGPRNPINLLKAIESINVNNRDVLDNVVFQFTGKWIGNESWDLGNIKLPDGIVSINSPVPYLKSLDEIKKSDIALILDADFDSSVFFPSKLVDYIGAKKPILAITPEGSCADIVRSVGGLVSSPGSIQSIENGIVSVINNLKSESPLTSLSEHVDCFSNSFVSKQFEVMLDQLVQK